MYAVVAFSCLLLALSGCSGDNDDDDGGITTPPVEEDSGGDTMAVDATDSGDSDTTADADDTETGDAVADGQGDAGGTDIELEEEHCGVSVREDLFQLEVGANDRINRSLGPATSDEPDCVGTIETDEIGAAVYQITVEKEALFIASIQGRRGVTPKPVMELHSGSCDSNRTVHHCGGEGQELRKVMSPDEKYFLWVYGTTKGGTENDPHFALEYDVGEVGCNPQDYPTCTGGQLATCEEAGNKDTYACASSCNDSNERCGGDRCNEAETIDVSSGSASVTADRYAYESDWTAAGKSNCVYGSNSMPTDTSGYGEYFARLEGISSGDTVVFDSVGTGGEDEGASAKNETNVAFFVIDGCDAEQCREAGAFDDNGDNRFEWTADSDGPVWLVAEALGGRSKSRAFGFDITVE